jgi:hypothetical protein
MTQAFFVVVGERSMSGRSFEPSDLLAMMLGGDNRKGGDDVHPARDGCGDGISVNVTYVYITSGDVMRRSSRFHSDAARGVLAPSGPSATARLDAIDALLRLLGLPGDTAKAGRRRPLKSLSGAR